MSRLLEYLVDTGLTGGGNLIRDHSMLGKPVDGRTRVSRCSASPRSVWQRLALLEVKDHRSSYAFGAPTRATGQRCMHAGMSDGPALSNHAAPASLGCQTGQNDCLTGSNVVQNETTGLPKQDGFAFPVWQRRNHSSQKPGVTAGTAPQGDGHGTKRSNSPRTPYRPGEGFQVANPNRQLDRFC